MIETTLQDALREWLPVAIRQDWSKKDLWYKCRFLVDDDEDEYGNKSTGNTDYLRGFCDAYGEIRDMQR